MPPIIGVGTKSGGDSYEAEVFVGQGDGTFKLVDAPIDYQSNDNSPSIRVADFLGGGSLGVAISAYEGPETYIHVWSGRCTP